MTDLGTCVNNRDLSWDVYRENGRQAKRAPRAELRAAINACRACPALAWCNTLELVPGMIIAGVIYDQAGEAWPSADVFARDTDQTAAPIACGDAPGTPKGYTRHQRAGEEPCDPCRSAAAAKKRAHRKPRSTCIEGHKFTPNNVAWDKSRRRICLTCHPEKRDTQALRRVMARVPHGTEEGVAAHEKYGGSMCVPCARWLNAHQASVARTQQAVAA